MTKKLSSVCFACALGNLLAASPGCGSSEAPCELAKYDDPAPHQEGFASVGENVRLHYLDFGGTGETLLFLAGSGNSAHVFDEFAPRFVAGFHVVAVTRRGFGESSAPASGYDPATLASDIAAFLDTMDIDRAVIVGHSLAGVEVTHFAIEYPERVIKLVYLDAAYDWASRTENPSTAIAPVQPNPTPSQVASPEAFASYAAWTNGVPSFPVADVRATNVFDCSGRYSRPRTAPTRAAEFATAAAAVHPNYARVAAPILAIYTVPQSALDMFPWLNEESREWSVANAYFPSAQAALAADRAAFAAAQPTAQVIDSLSVPHFLFLARPDLVASNLVSFLSGQ